MQHAPLYRFSRISRRVLVLSAASLLLAACGRKAVKGTPISAGSTVLALGDSLTSGVGATAPTSYPAVLQGLTGWDIVNGGISGNTSAQALARLPELLEEHHPALVIVSIGGNDFLKKQSVEALKNNIRSIVSQSQAASAQVVLVAIPEVSVLAAASGKLSDHALYADLAKELKLPLFADGWSRVLSDSDLRSDTVHANAAGYTQFANAFAKWLRESNFLT